MAYFLLPILLQFLMPLFSLIVMSAYLKGFVLIEILIVIVANALVLKLTFCKKRPLASLPKFFEKTFRQAKEDQKSVFLTALLTSWIAPCTIWHDNSFFLLASSLATFAVHSLGLLVTYIFAKHSKFLPTDLPPRTHCFEPFENHTQRYIQLILQLHEITKVVKFPLF